jgi:ectoine hydroxylase-related dioxygenase (phytanoyl-CoA dioxygenase family)
MSWDVNEDDVRRYRQRGYHVFPQVIPTALLRDLRREAAKARAVAYRIHGPQAQRLQPLKEHAAEFDLEPFRRFNEIEGLAEAIAQLTSPRHQLRPIEDAVLLFQPRDRPWSTEWHRDWRDHVLDADFHAHVGEVRWQEIAHNPDFFNQVNCPLFEDTSTWYVPGSHLELHNSAAETAVFRSTTQEELRDEAGTRTNEELERFCLNYCRAMPGAVQLVLNAGDFLIYRNIGWHIGNYVPYRERLTLHTQLLTPAFKEFREKYGHLLKPREASLERHAKPAS